MSRRKIINLLELAAETKMPCGWIKTKAKEGAIPCVQLSDSVFKFHRASAIRAVEKIVENGVKNV